MTQNKGVQEFGIFQDEFFDANNVDFTKNNIHQPVFIKRDLDSFPENMKALAIYRLNYILWIQSNICGGWTQKNLVPLIEKAKVEFGEPTPEWRTLARWWSRYKKSGFKVTSLIPQHKNKGNRKPRFDNIEEVLAKNAIAEYLDEKKPSIASVYQEYKDNIILQNEYRTDLKNSIKLISYQGFCKKIKKISTYELISARKGKYEAELDFRYVASHKPPTRVLERVELDHTPIDLILLDDELLVPLGRAYLTLLIDSYSHCILGFNLGFNEPGFYPVRNTLLNAFKPKTYIRDKYPNIIHDWPCHGKPETIVVDNGVEFWGHDLEQTCKELNINVQYNPVRKPWLKPLVERGFGIINSKLLDQIPGKTFSSILDRFNYDPVKDAVFKFSTFIEHFHEWIIDDYHFRPDSRKRYIPYLLWQNGTSEFPPKQFTEEEQKELDVIISFTDRRSHNTGGIDIHSLRYNSEELANYRMMYDEKQLKTKVLVKTNPNDISYVHVFIEEIGQYLKVPCIDTIGYTQGLSLQQHNINRRLQREYIDKSTDVVALAKVRQKLKERIQREVDEITSSRKKHTLKHASRLAKFQGVNSQQRSTIVSTDYSEIHSQQTQNELKNISDSKDNHDEWEDFVSKLDPF
jgi:putative transposase